MHAGVWDVGWHALHDTIPVLVCQQWLHTPVKDTLGVLIPLPAEHNELLPIITRPLLEDLDQAIIDGLVLQHMHGSSSVYSAKQRALLPTNADMQPNQGLAQRKLKSMETMLWPMLCSSCSCTYSRT